MKHRNFVILLLLALTGTSGIAQSYKLEPVTLTGGGGLSTGGTYQALGTIGQPAAGVLALMIDTIGFATRFFAEAMEETDKGPREALTAMERPTR